MITRKTIRITLVLLSTIGTLTRTVFSTAAESTATHSPSEASWSTGWRGPSRQGVYEAKGLPTEWSDTQNILWRVPMPAESSAEPIVVGNKVFTVAGRDQLLCHDLNTGKLLWQSRASRYAAIGKIKGLSEAEIEADDLIWELRWLTQFLSTTGTSGYGYGHGVPWQKSWGANMLDLYDIYCKAESKHPSFRFKDKIDREKLAAFPATEEKRTNKDERGPVLRKMLDQFGPHINSRYGSMPDLPGWFGWGCDLTGATPCSDGKYIYTSMGENQVACHDLEGKLRWITILEANFGGRGKINSQQVDWFPSPLVVKGKVVVWMGLNFACLDTDTGNILWNRPKPGINYAVASPFHINVENKKDVIINAVGEIVDLTTGKDVGNLGRTMGGGEGAGCTPPIAPDGTFVWWRAKDPQKDPKGTESLQAIRLKLVGDNVEPQILWEKPGNFLTGPSTCIFNGRLFSALRGRPILNMKDGSDMTSTQIRNPIVGGDSPSLAIADGHLYNSIGHACASEDWRKKRMEELKRLYPTMDALTLSHVYLGEYYGKRQLTYAVYDLDPDLRLLNTNTLTIPPIPFPIRDKFLSWLGREAAWKNHGSNQSAIALASPHIAGSRLLIRTAGELICIGAKP